MAPLYPSKCALSHCAALYAASLADPFNVHGVCVPNTPCFPSKKSTYWVKGSLTTSATSGWIFANPYDALTNESSCAWWTDGLADVPVLNDNSAVLGISSSASNTPWVNANFASAKDKLQYRVVSAGLRIRYTGTELDKGGTVVGLSVPTNHSLTGYTRENFLQLLGVHVDAPGRDWHSVVWTPAEEAQLDYSSVNPAGYTVMGAVPNCLGFYVKPPGTAVPYEFEFYVNVELMGSPVASSMTRMHADPIGFASIFDTISDGFNRYYRGSGRGAAIKLIEAGAETLATYSSAGPAGAAVSAGRHVGNWIYSALREEL